ncbi:hypothetical protein GCM10018954_023660 [Kutzneria kofuensis]
MACGPALENACPDCEIEGRDMPGGPLVDGIAQKPAEAVQVCLAEMDRLGVPSSPVLDSVGSQISVSARSASWSRRVMPISSRNRSS